MFKVKLEDAAKRDLKKLDPSIKRKIVDWIESTLDNIDNPRKMGKSLNGPYSDFWSYRFSNYRVVVDIIDRILIVSVVMVDDRKHIYKRLKNRTKKR